MNTIEAIQQHIVSTDENNGGPITYTAMDVWNSPEFATECLQRGLWADLTAITDEQRRILAAVVARKREVTVNS